VGAVYCSHTEVEYSLMCSVITPWLRSRSEHYHRNRRYQPSHWAWYRYHFRCIFYPLNACNPQSPVITAPCGQLRCNHIISQEHEEAISSAQPAHTFGHVKAPYLSISILQGFMCNEISIFSWFTDK